VTFDPYAPLPAVAEVDGAHATVAAATAAAKADAIATAAAVAGAAAGTAPVAVEDSATAPDTAEAVATTAKQAAATASDTAVAALLELVGVVPLLLSLDADPDTLKKDNTHNLKLSMERTLQQEREAAHCAASHCAAQRRICKCVCGLMSAVSGVASKAMK